MLATLHQVGLLTMILRSQIPNNSQWTRDWYGAYPGGAVTDPTGVATGERRVFRGGCWAFPARVCRSAIRDYDPPGNQMFNVGFRLALVPSPAR
jgi:formylglycine-generating enzyme required for sulfatase activity